MTIVLKQTLRRGLIFASLGGLTFLCACVTKSSMRQEQEVERLKQEVRQVRGDRADMDTVSDELRMEIARLNNVVEERAAKEKQQVDEMRREMTAMSNQIATLSSRIQGMESSRASGGGGGGDEAAERPERERPARAKGRTTYEAGKRQYDEGKFDDAVDTLKAVIRDRPKSDEGKRAQFLLGEAYYANKDFGNAALEFSEFKKGHPKDALVANAIYRQANAFRAMNKKTEAKLFYQELIEKFPKSPFSSKARNEMKKLK